MTDPTLENDYDDDSCESEYEDHEEETVLVNEEPVEVLKPLTVVLLKPISSDNKVSKIKRPVIFKGTKNGWRSFSCVKGMSNIYSNNETWDYITENWLTCEAKNIEVFWEDDPLEERVNEIIKNNLKFKTESEGFIKYGLDLDEEIEFLKAQAELF